MFLCFSQSPHQIWLPLPLLERWEACWVLLACWMMTLLCCWLTVSGIPSNFSPAIFPSFPEIIKEVKARKASADYMQGGTRGQNFTSLQGNPQTVLDPSKGVKRGQATMNRKRSMTEKKSHQLTKAHQNSRHPTDVIEDVPSTLLQENANIQASHGSIKNFDTLMADLNAPSQGSITDFFSL